jgi:hypothetical protein
VVTVKNWKVYGRKKEHGNEYVISNIFDSIVKGKVDIETRPCSIYDSILIIDGDHTLDCVGKIVNVICVGVLPANRSINQVLNDRFVINDILIW